MERETRVVAVVVVAVAVAAGAWFGAGESPDPLPLSPVEVDEPVAAELVVHVSGWVAAPGLVTVPDGSRVADTVAAAGGARPGASLESMNLAEAVRDGQHVVVPGPPDTAGGAPAGAVADDGRVRINEADAAELQELPGVGPVLAERIVEHRERSGPFETVEDLLDVPGIGEGKLASLRDAVIVP